MQDPEQEPMTTNYHVVSLIDVNELLPFVKRVRQNTDEPTKEEEAKLQAELDRFFSTLKRYYHTPIHYIGDERRYGKHLERYLINKTGFIEIMVEAPLHLNAHFISKREAETFAQALKKTLFETVPASPVRSMFIDSVRVQDKKASATYQTYDKLHHKLVYKPLILTATAINIIIVFGLLKLFFQYVVEHIFKTKPLIFGPIDGYAIFAAVITSFLFTILYEHTTRLAQKLLPT
ncbi:hypothetical protein D6783_02665 [Candidatus Woesearchaeota archaeon]|nr:MAG: hypothetical protein D6783_02665 [Candidatus Woesearchaeota archaeon]